MRTNIEIVDGLSHLGLGVLGPKQTAAVLDAAKRRIEALAAERDRLREALRFYADEWEHNGIGDPDEPHLYQSWMQPSKDLYEDEGDTARAALAAKETRDE